MFVDAIQRKVSKTHDKVRRRFVDPYARCFLLKRAGQTKRFQLVAEISEGWRYEFDEFRMQMRLSIASQDERLSDWFAQSSYVAVGPPDRTGSYEVFSIALGERDVIAPNGTSPLWQAFLTKEAIERYS